MKQIVVKACQRYNPSALWERVNPILGPGEIGIESDTNLFKFGNGRTPWNDLEYAGAGQANTTLTLTRPAMSEV
jgi:hypothetical protein